MNCQNCSNPLEPGAKYCGSCGLVISTETTSLPPQPPEHTEVIQPAALAPDNPLYVPASRASETNEASLVKANKPPLLSSKFTSIKWPAITGMVLGALYLLGSTVVYIEEFQDAPAAFIMAFASIDLFLGLLIFIPGTGLLIAKSAETQDKLLRVEYVASIVIVVLSLLSFRIAGVIFLLPALLSRQARSRLSVSS